tara:strand:- start:772 stop:1212 length:441 start_codon:yes stop_codon:yes gene_type:complete
MTYIPVSNKLPVLGFLEKNDPTNPESLQHQNINNISLVDNTNSTHLNDLKLKDKNALVFATFSREDELDSTEISILVGDSNDETRIARVIGDSSNSIQYRYMSTNTAIDMISAENGLNIRKYYSTSDTEQIDYGDGTCIFFIRSSN